jgi:hypothetical protein
MAVPPSGGETHDKTHNNDNLNPNMVAATHNIVLGRPLGMPLLGPDMIHDPKAVSQHLDRFRKVDLFQQFWSSQILFGYETSPIGKIISYFIWLWDRQFLSSHYLSNESKNVLIGNLYVTWTSVLMSCSWILTWTWTEFWIGCVGRLSDIISAI